MRRGFGLLLFCGLLMGEIPRAVLGADAAPLTDTQYLRDHAETRGFMLGRPGKAIPTPDDKSVLFLRSPARAAKLELYEYDVVSGRTKLLLTPAQVLAGAEEQLSPEEKARRERMRVSVGGFTDFQLSKDGKRVLLSLSGRLYLLDREPGKVRELETGKGTLLDPKFSPNGGSISYVLDHDVRVFDLKSNVERQVTKGGTDVVRHGVAEFVAQEELSRFSGYWWSPDETFIAYEESDHHGVEIWNVADSAKPGETPYPSYYPRPGKKNVSLRVGIVPASGGETAWVEWDRERFPYLVSFVWDKGGAPLMTVLTRDQHELELLEVDAAAGSTRVLLTEKDAAWVATRQDVPRRLPQGKGFLWASEKSNGWELQWRKSSGELERVLVGEDVHLRDVLHLDEKSGRIYFTARPDPTQTQLMAVSLDGGVRALTSAKGAHSASFGEGSGIFVEHSATVDSMPVSKVARADGSPTGELPSVAEAPPFAPRLEMTKVGGGKGFYAALVRPRDFKKGRRYPVIVNVYGGPLHADSSGMVSASMSSWLLAQWLADQGFVVVSLDGRGSPGRDHDWIRAIGKHFGSVPLDDQVAGLEALGKKYRAIDLKRVGLYGWSFGGYMSALGVLRRPDVFKAGVAGAPPTDWLDYDTCYTERYLGLPQTDAAAYSEGSLLNYAADLKRPLMLIHGTSDDNVYFRHTLKLADALFRAGKEFELLPLSSMTHMTPDPVVREQLYSRIARFFQEHLGRPGS